MLRSGEQIEIAFGHQRAVVATVGATLRSYVVRDRPVLDGFAADEVSPSGRGQVLMPWPNRIADGRYELSGTHHQLPIDEPALGHAIHGLVRWAEWRTEKVEPDTARFRYRLCARPGYPFPLDLAVEYRLAVGGLTVTFAATNIGALPCPFGMGAHPYFTLPGTTADEIELCVPAEEWIEVDARSIPRQRRSVKDSPVDFRRPRSIGSAKLDQPFARLERDSNGIASALLRHGQHELRLWLDRTFDYVQVFTGDTLADEARRRKSVAVEPMTCAANAFNTGEGLLLLSPGESVEGRWGVVAS